MSRGVFITFEGTEGAGKSTQLLRLAKCLEKRGCEVVTLREPGGTAIGEEIRHTLQHSHHNQDMAPETELLLFNASRAQLVRELIVPSLERGCVVLCDRFYDSTIAYQGYGRRMDLASVRSIIELAVGEAVPDLTIYLRISREASRARQKARYASEAVKRDRMEEEEEDFFERVDVGFERIMADEPARVKLVDGMRDPHEVQSEIWRLVEPLLPKV